MKRILHVSFLSYMLLVFGVSMAQVVGGERVFNPEGINCVSEEEYKIYHQTVVTNQDALSKKGLRLFQNDNIQYRSEQQVSFIWPVKQAAGFEYKSTWAISNYLDHDTTTGALQDWNCGTRTYDTPSGYNHQGVDIFLWPFTWKQVEDEQTEVIAAAAGQIVYKNDGSSDQNCSFNNDLWNAVFVEHSDGSIAWYGHMKNGSLTSKNVGDTVQQGEYLGIVASSGNSTGPHLHFEVYDDNNNLIDPYSGSCNALNDTSWWADQKEYLNSGVNAALTHTDLPNFGTCPEIEETFESDQFDPGDTIWFIGYFKDQVTGTAALNEIYDPSGNLFSSWNTNFNDDFVASWWAQQRTISDQTGEWTYIVTYNGESDTHTFTVGQLSVEDEVFDEVRLFPNPTNGIVTLGAPVPFKQITVRDALGRTVLEYTNLNDVSVEMDLSYIRTGIYFVTAEALDSDAQTVLKVLKK